MASDFAYPADISDAVEDSAATLPALAAVKTETHPAPTATEAEPLPLFEEEEPLAYPADISDAVEDSAAALPALAAVKTETHPAPTAPPATAVTPRLIRLQPTQKAAPATHAKKQTSSAKQSVKRRGILGIIFKK